MKNIYATLLTGTALLLAGATQAQLSKGPGSATTFQSVHPTSHSISQPNDTRGGVPANDECGGAVAQNLAAGATLSFSGDNTGATVDAPTTFVIVWESFITTECLDVVINYCVTGSEFTNFLINLAIQCPDFVTGVLTGANDACTLTFTDLPAGTYYIPVMVDATATPVGPYTIEATGTACPPPPPVPVNDECAGAISLTSTAACSPTPFTTNGATETLPSILCAGFTSPNANDVWFSFVATSTDQTIGVAGYNAADAMVELFEGTCAAPVSLGCADATFPATADETTTEQLIQGGLTIGATYWVRVYDYAHTSVEHNFDICVTEGAGNNVGIEENSGIAAWSIFPNPGAGIFNLQYTGASGAAGIEVFDVTGRVVYNERTSLSANHTMDLSVLSSGNYTVRVTMNDQRSEQRLVVK